MKADAPEAPVVEGYEFIGWSQSIDNITGPITVKARYDLKKFKVDFISDGKVVHTQMVKTGELPVIPDDLNKYAKEGYHFAGFNKEITSVTGNVSYTIDWDLNEYIVSFVDYYNQVLAEVKVYHGERIPKYVFSGDDYYGENENWYTTNSFINLYNFNSPIKDNLTLYGQFDFILSTDLVHRAIELFAEQMDEMMHSKGSLAMNNRSPLQKSIESINFSSAARNL